MNDPSFIERLLHSPLETVAEFYAGSLSDNPRASEFVKEELSLDSEQATQKRIGFADRTLGKQIPHRRVKAGRQVRDLLVSLGLYKANGRETMRGRVTEPILDDEGNVTGLRGYKIDPHADGPAVKVVSTLGEPTAALAAGLPQQTTVNETSDDPPERSEADVGDDELTIEENRLVFHRDDRRYRIGGLEKNASTCTLKVSLMASRDGLVHLDSLDLVKARSRASFVKATAAELYVDADLIKKDIGQLLLKLETRQAERIAQLKSPKAVDIKLSDAERSEAMDLLRDPKLLQRIAADMDACGIVGESTGKLAGYLAATSRKLDRPLAVLIQSSSSAGKTSLMDAVLAMMPGEDVRRFSGMTGQSLFYLDSDQIRHKILAIAEDEGIKEAAYALKLLQSEGQLRHATVGRGSNGRSETQEHHVQGPVQIFLTTTAMDLDEELVNRCLVLSVDETDAQTGAIQSQQRESFTSRFAQHRHVASRLMTLHQNAQRLLRPIDVFNPYAPQLTFPHHKTRMRRDHVKYLTLINTIAFLHQHQRTIHQGNHDGQSCDYINVERNDIAVANSLAGEVLGRSLDELSPQTRILLLKLHDFVASQTKSTGVPHAAFRFNRRELRQSIQWSDFQVRSHLKKLVDLEYVLVHRGRGGQRYVYELLYGGEGRQGQPFLMGLIDPAKLKQPSSADAPTSKTPSIQPSTPSIQPSTPSIDSQTPSLP